MELFQRVKKIAYEITGSEAKLASRLSIPQTTFNGYLKLSRQDNLWPLLAKILKEVPQVSRDWLYFGEGEMLNGSKRGAAPLPDHGDSDRSDEVVGLKKEIAYLREIINSKEEMLSLYKRLLQNKEQAEERSVAAKDIGTAANIHPIVHSLK